MKNLYEAPVYSEVVERMNRLSPSSERQWGKMGVAQMMAHCKEAFKVPLSDKPMKRAFIGALLGGLFKKQLYSDKPYKQGLPTSPLFKITGDRDFEAEKKGLSELMSQFHTLGPEKTGQYPHPFFGTFTKEQWGMSMYKHLDHHFRQFGA